MIDIKWCVATHIFGYKNIEKLIEIGYKAITVNSTGILYQEAFASKYQIPLIYTCTHYQSHLIKGMHQYKYHHVI